MQYDIRIEAKQAIGQLQKIQQELKGLRSDMQKTDKATVGASGGFTKLKVAAGALAVVFAAFKSVKIAGEFEKLQAVLKSVTGSTQEAGIAFKFVQDIAKGLPFSLQEITTAYTKMTALGIQPTREALVSFANTAAATGKSLDQFVEAVADAVTGEFERLKEFGIKVKNEGDTLRVTFQGVTQEIQNDAASINKYLKSIGENQFAGAAADQMDTLTGKWSVFTDEVSKAASEFATSTGLLDLAKDSLDFLTEALEYARENFSEVVEFLKSEIPAAFKTWTDWIGLTGEQVSWLGDTVASIFGTMGTFMKAVFTDTRHVGVALVDGLVQGFLSLQKWWNVFLEAMSFGWDKTINAIAIAFNSLVNELIEIWNSVADFFGLDSLNIALLDVTDNTESWADRMARVNGEYENNLKVHRNAIDLWHQEIDAQNRIKELEKERKKVLEELALDEHNEELKRRQEELNKQVAAEKKAAAAQKELNDAIKEATKDGEKLAETYRKWQNPLAEIKKREDEITKAFNAGKLSIQDYNDAMKQLDRERSEATQRQLDESKNWADGWNRAFMKYKESAEDAASNAENFFNNTMSSMEDALVDFVKTGKFNWEDLANQIIADLIRIQVRRALAGIFGGTSGGSIFGGFFADGGYLPAGKVGIVGERGPELISGPANITPLDGKAGGSNITYNINAVDAKSFKEMVARDPQFIYAITEEGRRRLPYR